MLCDSWNVQRDLWGWFTQRSPDSLSARHPHEVWRPVEEKHTGKEQMEANAILSIVMNQSSASLLFSLVEQSIALDFHTTELITSHLTTCTLIRWESSLKFIIERELREEENQSMWPHIKGVKT